jgi:hypothetical protein
MHVKARCLISDYKYLLVLYGYRILFKKKVLLLNLANTAIELHVEFFDII